MGALGDNFIHGGMFIDGCFVVFFVVRPYLRVHISSSVERTYTSAERWGSEVSKQSDHLVCNTQ